MIYVYNLFALSDCTGAGNVNATFCSKPNGNRKIELCVVLKTQLNVSCVVIEQGREFIIQGTSIVSVI